MNASLDTFLQSAVLPEPSESPSTSRADARPPTPRDGPDFRDTFAAVHQQQRPSVDGQRTRSEIADDRDRINVGERPLTRPTRNSRVDEDKHASREMGAQKNVSERKPSDSEDASDGDEAVDTDRKAQRLKALAARGALREVPLGRSGTLLVAGEPPTDEDLLDFAKSAGLPDTAVAALLLGANGVVEGSQPDLHGIPGAEAELAALGLSTSGMLAAQTTGGLGAPGPLASPGLAASLADTGIELDPADGVLQSALAGAIDDASDALASLELSEVGEGEPLGTFVAHRIRVPILDPQAATVWSQRAEQFIPGEGVRIDPLVLRSVIFEKLADSMAPMPTAADRLASLQAADLGASAPPDGPDADINRIAAAEVSAGGSSRLGGGSLGTGQGDGGQSRQANQHLAQRFGELMSQRLVQQIAQGNWKVNMDVHPRALGEIQIELQWKGGELEASFRANQMATRDLLQEALPRLRETLERAGTDVASLTVGDSSRQKNGDQTGHNRNRNEQSAVQPGGVQPGDVVEGLTSRPAPSDGRLDVLV